MFKKKITKLSLEELAKVMPVIEEWEMRTMVGGGTGGVYTMEQFQSMLESGTWTSGGYVEGMGYVLPEVVITGVAGGGFNMNAAIAYLNSYAHATSQRDCAMYVRLALEAGGMSTYGRPPYAHMYDTWLASNGFTLITGNYKAGDIVVHEATTGHEYGHIAMYNGSQWISDFRQSDMYGGSAYRKSQNYTVWRKNGY